MEVYSHHGFHSEHEIITRAYLFAEAAHREAGQLRKYTGQPYIVHPLAVADLVRYVAPDDHALIAAALLHDVVEDTARTSDDIYNEFGFDIARLVSEVTDVSTPSDGYRAQRKNLDLQHIARASVRGMTLKLGDLTHNTESIVEYDADFSLIYLPEKIRLLHVLKDGHAALYKLALGILLTSVYTIGDAALIRDAEHLMARTCTSAENTW